MSKSEGNKALITLIKDAVTEVGIKLAEGLPVVGSAVGVIKGLVENSKNLYDAINRQKLYDFYMGIYELDDDKEKYITKENLAFIIKKLLQDDEEQKSNFYSRLTVNVARSEHSERERIDFISVLSNLSCNDIDMAIRIFVHEKFKIKSYKNTQEQLVNISKTKIGNELKSLNTLMLNGLIYEPVKGKAGIQYYAMTEFMEHFLSLIIDESKLTPESLRLERKDKSDIFFEQDYEYMRNKAVYDEKIIKPLEDLGYTVKVREKIYGPYNDDCDIYIRLNKEKPFREIDKIDKIGKINYLSMMILTSEEMFFSDKPLLDSDYKYNVSADLLSHYDTTEIMRQLKFNLDEAMKYVAK